MPLGAPLLHNSGPRHIRCYIEGWAVHISCTCGGSGTSHSRSRRQLRKLTVLHSFGLLPCKHPLHHLRNTRTDDLRSVGSLDLLRIRNIEESHALVESDKHVRLEIWDTASKLLECNRSPLAKADAAHELLRDFLSLDLS